MSAKILITGGAGFVGNNLLRTLLRDHHQLWVLDDLSSGHQVFLPKEVTFLHGSITDDHALQQAFACRPDYVIHMAALFANQNSVEHPQKDLQVNGLGTIKVLEHSVAHQVKKLLYISSSCIYGAKAEMHEEDGPAEFLDTPYAITKLLGEQYCQFWAESTDLDIVIARLFNAYGPFEKPGAYRNVIPNFFQQALEGKPLPITGTGEETRDFTFAEDTAEGLKKALFTKTAPADVFNIGTGQETRLLDVAETINRLTGNAGGIAFKPRRSWDHVPHRRAVIKKATKILGYQPQFTIEEGLQRTYEWVKTHFYDKS